MWERSCLIDLEKLQVEIGKEFKTFVSNFIKELEEKLMEEIYTIDRFEGEFAVCENRESGKMINIKKEDLPQNIKEGSIIKYKNGEYSIDEEKEQEISDRIKQKMDNLWN